MHRWSMMKTGIHSPNLVGIGSWGPEIWPHEYLISSIEISVNWPGSKHIWTRSVYTDFNAANEVHSCGYILGHQEPIHIKFGVWGFFIMFYWNMVMKMPKCKKKKKKKKIWWCHTSVLYRKVTVNCIHIWYLRKGKKLCVLSATIYMINHGSE